MARMSGSRNAVRRPPIRMQLPLLDRLVDEAPQHATDIPLSAGDHLTALRRSVHRDIEMLLNARRLWRSFPPELRELALSPLTYGIPDCTAGAFRDKRQRETLRQTIEDTLRRFEPRFARVNVTLTDNRNPLEATLRLHIDALLYADPAPEPIAFDTLVDAATASVVVRSDDG